MALDSLLLAHGEMLERISRRIGYDYRIASEDIRSEMTLWICENEERAEALAESPGLLHHRLSSVARRFAVREQAQAYGHNPDDLAQYSLRALRALLYDVFDYEDWQTGSAKEPGMPKSKSTMNTSMDKATMLADIKAAMAKLPAEVENILVWTYKYQLSVSELAERLEVTEDAASKRLQRAVQRLQKELNEVRPMERPQRRAVMSNAAARALQSGHWEG